MGNEAEIVDAAYFVDVVFDAGGLSDQWCGFFLFNGGDGGGGSGSGRVGRSHGEGGVGGVLHVDGRRFFQVLVVGGGGVEGEGFLKLLPSCSETTGGGFEVVQEHVEQCNWQELWMRDILVMRVSIRFALTLSWLWWPCG